MSLVHQIVKSISVHNQIVAKVKNVAVILER